MTGDTWNMIFIFLKSVCISDTIQTHRDNLHFSPPIPLLLSINKEKTMKGWLNCQENFIFFIFFILFFFLIKGISTNNVVINYVSEDDISKFVYTTKKKRFTMVSLVSLVGCVLLSVIKLA